MTISPARTRVIGLAALGAGAGVVALQLASDHRDPRAVWAVFGPVVGLSFVGTGLYAWRRRPDSRTGALMVLLGFAWFLYMAEASNAPLVHLVGAVCGGVWGAVFLHLAMSYPTGRLDPGWNRNLVIAGYVIFPLAVVPPLLFSASCDDCPRNLLLVEDDDGLELAAQLLGALVYLGLFSLVLWRSILRWRAAGPLERLQITPVFASGLVTFLLVTVALAGVEAAWWGAWIAAALLPYAFLGGLLRTHVSRLEAELRARVEELRASRARIVHAADDERRRLERDLHDGAQARLVGLALLLRSARGRAEGDGELAALLDQAQDELQTSLGELRELARGIHPAVLTDRGLEPALEALAARVPVPVRLEVEANGRLPDAVESAAYFVVSEALTNVAKYAKATEAAVAIRRADGLLTVEVRDDGVGGADAAGGSGLRGLADRVSALDGKLSLESPPGRGTRIRADIPCPAL
jgi:signal transduction histidine kinase